MAAGDNSGRTSIPLLFSSLGILGVASTVMWSIWTIVVHLVTPPINKRGNDFLSGNHDFAFAAFLGLVPQILPTALISRGLEGVRRK
uniref:Uncharacterized protein n=1 Tax=Cannabis sativa TaxID=3483 RepID=A0A803QFT5_CANSA